MAKTQPRTMMITPEILDRLEAAATDIHGQQAAAIETTNQPPYRKKLMRGLLYMGLYTIGAIVTPLIIAGTIVAAIASAPVWTLTGVATACLTTVSAVLFYKKSRQYEMADPRVPVALAAQKQLENIFGQDGKTQIFVNHNEFPRLKTILTHLRNMAYCDGGKASNKTDIGDQPVLVKRPDPKNPKNKVPEGQLRLRLCDSDYCFLSSAYRHLALVPSR